MGVSPSRGRLSNRLACSSVVVALNYSALGQDHDAFDGVYDNKNRHAATERSNLESQGIDQLFIHRLTP
jgi:hypothetical protein